MTRQERCWRRKVLDHKRPWKKKRGENGVVKGDLQMRGRGKERGEQKLEVGRGKKWEREGGDKGELTMRKARAMGED